MRRVVPYILDPPSAEAMGAWAAVLLGRDVGGTTIILEGDSIIGSGVSIVKRGFKQPGLCMAIYYRTLELASLSSLLLK